MSVLSALRNSFLTATAKVLFSVSYDHLFCPWPLGKRLFLSFKPFILWLFSSPLLSIHKRSVLAPLLLMLSPPKFTCLLWALHLCSKVSSMPISRASLPIKPQNPLPNAFLASFSWAAWLASQTQQKFTGYHLPLGSVLCATRGLWTRHSVLMLIVQVTKLIFLPPTHQSQSSNFCLRHCPKHNTWPWSLSTIRYVPRPCSHG